MTINNKVAAQDIVQIEHENNANAKRVMLIGKTANGDYVDILVDSSGQLLVDSNAIVGLNAICGWEKTPSALILESGSANSDVANKLVDTAGTFISNGVEEGMIVRNVGSGAFAIVDTVESETTLLLRPDYRAGSTASDIFPAGTGSYSVYGTKEWSSSWAEMNGQTISDSSSIWNGKTLPDRNSTNKFLRGNLSSGATGGEATHVLLDSELPPLYVAYNLALFRIGTGTQVAKNDLTVGGLSTHQVTGNTGYGTSTPHNNEPQYADTIWMIKIK